MTAEVGGSSILVHKHHDKIEANGAYVKNEYYKDYQEAYDDG
ncbi:MAG TPA: hypothetical protein VFN56_02170 [Candidatus Saccharimonadales bacterium]|nr:hypothetical protein [Candidatus Saccharimonadales bacterium]